MVDKYLLKFSFLKKDIFKVFSLTALSTVVRMLTGLISVKIVAILLGPSGIALLGQLNNFTAIAFIFSTAGITNGITKYVAEYRDSQSEIQKLLSTALKIVIAFSVLCGILMIFLNKYISRSIMLSEEYSYLFIIFGLFIIFYSLNSFITSVLNGYKEFKLFVYVNILGSIFGLIFTLTFIFFGGLQGALISAVTFQSMMLIVSLWMVRKSSWLKKSFFNKKIDKNIVYKYLHYSSMTLVTALTAPVAQIALRAHVISQISSVQAGWWEAMNRLSNMYLMIITTSFSVYYLPRLSEITSKAELRKEIILAYKIIIPCLILVFCIIFSFRFFIIRFLFTKEFLGMEQLFFWQLLGDFFKICSWILAYLMIAKRMTRQFIFSEIIFTSLFVILAFYLMNNNGIEGITQAYAINYFIYLIAMIILFRSTLFVSFTDV